MRISEFVAIEAPPVCRKSQKLLIGVDEAGYGPNMGPLTICATAWRVPSSFDAAEMTRLLEPEFLAKPIKRDSRHIPIGDSKKIHKDSLAVEGLILGARYLGFELDGQIASEWDPRIASFASLDWNRLAGIPWYAKRPSIHTVVLDQTIADQPAYFHAASEKLYRNAIRLAGVRMRVIDEVEFNRQVDLKGKKSTLLSVASLELVKQVIGEFANVDEAVEVYCDKHGGRNRYHPILTYVFDEQWFAIEVESRACSRYATRFDGHAMQIQFKVDGDSIFPSAAASIIAKWTREELMDRLNGFWLANVSDRVAATAGYYVDALRFAAQIEGAAAKLSLGRDLWWRKK